MSSNTFNTTPVHLQTSLPGELRWVQLPLLSNHAAWDSAQLNGVRLMPPAEANSDQALPTHLSPQQLAATIELTEIAIQKHMQVAFPIAMINKQFPDLPAFFTFDEVRAYPHSPYEQDPQGMAVAHQRTMDRLKAAGYVPQDDITSLK